ncbi:PIN domain-containing protein [Natronobiforma cellulositropha]|uniref:PIN domain-containing protein n=1 Tax=Natronobiforma cellulositropha TaxID=1679076 RepID=UPI0021D58BB7|nr:PIN domain-containing protein [Natronobiforma cellulositropha]
MKHTKNVCTNERQRLPNQTSKSGWSESVYVDTDVVLAVLKTDDWLSSSVDLETIADPKTSVATRIEVQYAMEGEWDREQRTVVHERIVEEGISLVPLRFEHIAAGSALQRAYDRLNLFDAVHLGVATVLDEPIVSTDTLYPTIREVDHVDPRDLE